MGDDRIDELLTKLQKLDPETYEKLSGQWMMAGTVFQYEIDEETKTWHTVRNYFAIIQGVIQDAIAAHSGWWWSIDFDGPHPWAINLWRCQISFGDFRTAWGGTPAEAILAAYVAALEAEAAR